VNNQELGNPVDAGERSGWAVPGTSRTGRPNAEILDLRARIVEDPLNAGACYLFALTMSRMKARSVERIWLKRSAILNPRDARYSTSQGISKLQEGDIDAAHAAFSRALRYNPSFVAARYNRSLIELEAMHLERGWSDYEARFSYPVAPGSWRDFPSPDWDGKSSLDGKLLVWCEQALSTQILFLSVLPELDLPGGFIVEAAPELAPLLERGLPQAEIVAMRDPPDPRLSANDIAAQIPMGRLCGVMRRSRGDFTKATPGYLSADPDRAIDFMLDLVKPERRTIGISWWKSSNDQGGLSLELLEPILRTPNVTWVNLEGAYANSEIQGFQETTGIRIENSHGVDPTRDLEDLAAIITACDLVLAVDTPAAHLAGALGRMVWALLPNRRAARWFWFSQHLPRPTKFSRWYRSMRLVWKSDEESIQRYVERIGGLVEGALKA
jgi:hypothetical protein